MTGKLASTADATKQENLANVPIEFVQFAFALIVTVIPVVVMIRLLAGHEDFGFDALVRTGATLPWPKGVQGEEPQPWRFDSAAA